MQSDQRSVVSNPACYWFVFQGAGLDVTVPEPLPLDHPLLTLKNCGKNKPALYCEHTKTYFNYSEISTLGHLH